MRPTITLRQALSDPLLLGGVLGGPSWQAWRVILLAAMGEPLTDEERTVYTKLTGRDHEPTQRVEELVAVVGRRGGKSRAIAVLACYLAALCDYRDLLSPGETALLLCIAPDQRQARIVRDYCEGVLEQSPILRQLIVNRTADSLELSNGVAIEIRASNFRRLRGPTYIGVVADECAFYMDEGSANPDAEILNSVRPGLATTRGLLAMISSPYARRGELYEAWRQHHGPSGDPLILVAQGGSRDFNPTLPQAVIDRAMERDAASASAEYLAQFRRDIEGFVTREVVDAAVVPSRHELPPVSDVNYVGFCDAAGGSGGDSFTAAVAYLDRNTNRVVLAAVRERKPPFSPAATIEEFSTFFKSYGCHRIVADRWAGEFPVEHFRNHGITVDVSERVKSDIYKELLPLLNSGRVELLDNQRLAAQLVGLERRTARSGKDSIDHAPGGHDDLINSAAGALVRAADELNGLGVWERLGSQPFTLNRGYGHGLSWPVLHN